MKKLRWWRTTSPQSDRTTGPTRIRNEIQTDLSVHNVRAEDITVKVYGGFAPIISIRIGDALTLFVDHYKPVAPYTLDSSAMQALTVAIGEAIADKTRWEFR